MSASEIRLNARKILKGKWGKAVLMTLAYALFTFIVNFILNFIPVVGSIISLIISVPIYYGFVASFIDLKRNQETNAFTFTSEGFGQFSKAWAVYLRIILKCLIPIILLIISIGLTVYATAYSTVSLYTATVSNTVPTTIRIISLILIIISCIWLICRNLSYSLSNYILKDNPDMTSKEIIEESARLMNGNRLKLIWLGITFIGWYILSSLTLGIGLLWVLPYTQISTIEFYEQLSGKSNNVVEIEEVDPIN